MLGVRMNRHTVKILWKFPVSKIYCLNSVEQFHYATTATTILSMQHSSNYSTKPQWTSAEKLIESV